MATLRERQVYRDRVLTALYLGAVPGAFLAAQFVVVGDQRLGLAVCVAGVRCAAAVGCGLASTP
jgi:hypothetical protein